MKVGIIKTGADLPTLLSAERFLHTLFPSPQAAAVFSGGSRSLKDFQFV
jgi:hypothetical protein